MSMWTQENVERLKRCRLDGLSAGEIAARLNQAHGLSLNRNKVLGKLYRLGLSTLPRKRKILFRRPPKRRHACAREGQAGTSARQPLRGVAEGAVQQDFGLMDGRCRGTVTPGFVGGCCLVPQCAIPR